MKHKHEYLFSNGDLVKEKITGFEGTITGSVHYLTGCNQYLIVPKCENPSKVSQGEWYDEGRLELINNDNIKASDVEEKKNGADKAPPNNH